MCTAPPPYVHMPSANILLPYVLCVPWASGKLPSIPGRLWVPASWASRMLKVPLAKMYNGGEITFSITRLVLCKGCRGATARQTPRCRKCTQCPNQVVMVKQQMEPFVMNVQKKVKSDDACRTDTVKQIIPIEQGMQAGS